MNQNVVIGQKAAVAMGFLLAGLTFFYAVSYINLLVESDLWWHIKTGMTILANKAVPHVDPFSYSHEGQPWIAKEWLAQILYALSYDALGWVGPQAMAAAALAATAWLMFRRSARELQPIYAIVLVIFAIAYVKGVTVARPHILTFPMAVFLTTHVFDRARAGLAPSFWALAIIVLWANIHASFPIAFLICGCAFLDYVERKRLSDRSTLLRWIVFLALCPLVALINPYFAQPYLIALDMANGLKVMSHITEWTPLLVDDNHALEVAFMAMIAVLLWLRPKLTIGQILFALMCLHMMLSHLRFQYLFILLVPLVMLADVIAVLPKASANHWLAQDRDKLESFLGRNAAAVGAAMALMAVAYTAYSATTGRVFPPESIAVSRAIAYVKQHQATDPALQMHVLNDYNTGGPLIFNGIKTYVDGRAEQLFLGDFMQQYIDSGEKGGEVAIAKMLEDPSVGWTIFSANSPRNDFIAKVPGWQKTYEDDAAVIFERKSP